MWPLPWRFGRPVWRGGSGQNSGMRRVDRGCSVQEPGLRGGTTAQADPECRPSSADGLHPFKTAREGTMAPSRRANPISDCPLTAALSAIGGKWKLIIVYWLAESPRQFGELRQLLPAMSQKVLAEQLRELIDDDLVTRERTGPVPAPVIYSLTEYGRALVPLMESVRHWGRGHISHFDAPADSRSAASMGEKRQPVREPL